MPKDLGGGLTLQNVLFCEDIRPELNHKHTLLGVSIGPAGVPAFPALIKIAAFLELTSEKAGSFNFQVRWSVGGLMQIEGGVQGNINPPAHAGIVLPPILLNITAPGDILLEIRVGDGDWIEVQRTRIDSAEKIIALATASEPPSSQSPPVAQASMF